MTSNLPFNEWTEILGSERATGALETDGVAWRNILRTVSRAGPNRCAASRSLIPLDVDAAAYLCLELLAIHSSRIPQNTSQMLTDHSSGLVFQAPSGPFKPPLRGLVLQRRLQGSRRADRTTPPKP